jgi:hypothetical protein
MPNDLSLKDFSTDLVSGITDEAEKKVLLKLVDKLDEPLQRLIDKRVGDQLAQAKGVRVLSDQERKYRNIKHAFHNSGYLPDGSKVTYEQVANADIKRAADFEAKKASKGKDAAEAEYRFSDGTFMWNNPMLIPKLIADVVREPQEIVPMLTGMLTKIRFEGPYQSVMFPAASSTAFGHLDLAEGDPYPEAEMEFGGTVSATMGKCGVMVKFTDETIRFSRWDVMGMHLRAAGMALARWKEQKASDHIFSQGVTFLDNSDVTARHSTGRNAQWYFNGTLSLHDLLAAYGDALNDGFIPDALIMHPMAWTIFAQDPTMRAWAYAAGGVPWVRPQGEVGTVKSWLVNNGTIGSTEPTDPTQLQTTWAPVPGIFPWPLKIIVSPFVPFDSTNSTTDILLCDSRELGILAVNEEIVTEDWRDPLRDINNVKMRERYAIQVLNNGHSIRVLKNIVIARSYDLDDRLALAITGSVPTGEQFPSFA